MNENHSMTSDESLAEAQKETQYGYWEGVYGRGFRLFDWISDWSEVRPLLSEYLHPANIVLHIGCGNSKMCEELLDDNFDEIVNLDFSPQVIQIMSEHYKDVPKLKWVVGDCANLSFNDETFDYVFDKGALDAIYCGQRREYSVPSTFREVTRVLKKGGYFILLSIGMFEANNQYLQLAPSNLKLCKKIEFVPKEGTTKHFGYVYQKE